MAPRQNRGSDKPGKLSKREKELRQRLKDDFIHYAERCLRIKDKAGSRDPVDGGFPRLKLNDPQKYIHAKLEEQLRTTGKVRAIILKGRQQGCSTYTEGRFYWKVTHRRGVRAFILTHKDDATANLFDMVKTYHEQCPKKVRPRTKANNEKALLFDKLGSGYKVSTAGSAATGRSSTIQYFHGSEVAYWPNADTHAAGVLQAVADEPGTEIILESTSNGPQGYFYEQCMKAKNGEGDFILIFIPWFWSREYRKPVPPGFVLTSEEERYKSLYDLDDGQMAWRRAKIVELNGAHHFRREYPATVEEAFKAAALGAIWTQELIDANRRPHLPVDANGEPLPMVKVAVAVDPSGGDGPENDEVGIMVGGLCSNGEAYVWKDASGKMTPGKMGEESVLLFHAEGADKILAEINFGAKMVETIVASAAKDLHQRGKIPSPYISFEEVHASRGKAVRAEPVKALYEQGKVHHVGYLLALEEEQVTWEPDKSKWSPNRMDSLVWLITYLLLGLSGKVKSKAS